MTDKVKFTYRFFVRSFQLTKNAKRVFVGSVQIILWILLCFLFLWTNDQKYLWYSYLLLAIFYFLQTVVYILSSHARVKACC